jgi:choline dehydrogenase-like flavoprotein
VSVTDLGDLPDGTVLDADLCIVGAGAAGITIARALEGRGLDIVLLESGTFETEEPTQALYQGAVVGEPLRSGWNDLTLDQVRLRYFGGTTNHWAGFCRPLERIDFERRPQLAVSGWPIDLDVLAPWYEQAVSVIRLASPRFDLDWWTEEHEIPPPLLDGDDVSTSLFQIHYPFSFGAAYRREMEEATDVQLILRANATQVVVAPESDRVEAIDVAGLDGRTAQVRARAFVVALGGIETPRLLLASNEVRERGLGNEHDLVGRHFTEHLQTMAAFAVLDMAPDALQLYTGQDVEAPHPDDPDNRMAVKGALTLPYDVVAGQELLGFEAQLLTTPPAPGSPEYANGITIDEVRALSAGVSGTADQTVAYMQVTAEQQLDPESRVLLGSERDALGMPKVDLDWRHSTLDRQSIVTGLQHVATALGRRGLGRVQLALGAIQPNEERDPGSSVLGAYAVDASSIDLESFPIGIGYHHMCTARMADAPGEGVVDRDCRVHELGNLYLAGSSVFATGGTATPTFTITALALRLADHLRTTVLA